MKNGDWSLKIKNRSKATSFSQL